MISSRNAAARAPGRNVMVTSDHDVVRAICAGNQHVNPAQHDQGNQGTPDGNDGPEPAPVLSEITGHAIGEQRLLGKLRAETTQARDQASYSDREQ
jgi:hypothetical protein